MTTNKKTAGDVLNLVKDKHGFFNGVLFKINQTELIKLKEREGDYNLEEVDCYDFNSGKKLSSGFVVVDYAVGIDKRNRKPNLEYLRLCRQAAYQISAKFGQMWDETTFTAQGEKLSAWFKTNKISSKSY